MKVEDTEFLPACRLPGGNHLHEIRVDLKTSFENQDKWLTGTKKRSVRKSQLHNLGSRVFYHGLKRLGWYDSLVSQGIIHDWFDEFIDYWVNCLEGRPISVIDYQLLTHDYRKRFHVACNKEWESDAQHIANYQTPDNLFLTFSFVLREALNRVRNHELLPVLKPGMRVLEFGCSIAPMYRTWRQFATHKDCHWVLADIASFPFHYARHVYAHDQEVTTTLITEDLFDDPLKNIEGDFDLIIMQEVFEHLHKPMHIAQYLHQKIRKNGLLFFDYIKSDATGLDTLAGLTERPNTLDFLYNKFTPVSGRWAPPEQSVGMCLGRKK